MGTKKKGMLTLHKEMWKHIRNKRPFWKKERNAEKKLTRDELETKEE